MRRERGHGNLDTSMGADMFHVRGEEFGVWRMEFFADGGAVESSKRCVVQPRCVDGLFRQAGCMFGGEGLHDQQDGCLVARRRSEKRWAMVGGRLLEK